MKSQRAYYLPAAAAVLISILFIAYSFYAAPHGAGHMPPQAEGVRPPGGGHKEGIEPFKLMGTLAVILGAVSFFWLRMKNKLTSSSLVINRLARLVYKAHQPAGWAVLLLITAHGTYYLVTKMQDPSIYTGLAAFLTMAVIGVYGWMIRRGRNRGMRKIHLFLSVAWIPVLLLHAGGSAVVTIAVTAVLWGGVRWLEGKTPSITGDKQMG